MPFWLLRAIQRRKIEILITFVVFVLALSFIVLSISQQRLGQSSRLIQLGDRVAFAMVIALVVRWITVIFAESETSEHSSPAEYHEAVKNAKGRIWICQTWLPGIDQDCSEIIKTHVADVRLLLASFKEGSPIFARIQGRDIKVLTAQCNVEGSVRGLVQQGRNDCIRFNFGHHPGWIAIIDSIVFWGPTPVDQDNHTVDFFHRHKASDTKGKFWVDQFVALWERKDPKGNDKFSHAYKQEQNYNSQLP